MISTHPYDVIRKKKNDYSDFFQLIILGKSFVDISERVKCFVRGHLRNKFGFNCLSFLLDSGLDGKVRK